MIKRVQLKSHSPEWYAWRQEHGYGGSEIAGVLAEYIPVLQDYIWTFPLEVHLGKIGEKITEFSGNFLSEAGHYMEGNIIDLYRHWDNDDPDVMKMYQNIRDGKKLNHVRRATYYETNDKYPWLFVSPDGKEYLKEDGVWVPKGLIECKNTTSMEANRYPNKVSPSFIAQVALGLMITELEYARILIFIDGNKFEVVTIYRDSDSIQELFKLIQQHSLESWKRVLQCRKIKLEHDIEYYYQYNVDEMSAEQQEGASILQSMEPDLIGTDKEHKFIVENLYQTEELTKMELTDQQWELLVERKKIKEEIEDGPLKRKLNLVEEKLKLSLEGAHVAEFEGNKAFSLKPDKNGKMRFYVADKIFQLKADE